MQIPNSFFHNYNYDFSSLIRSIAQAEEEGDFIKNCNELLDGLNECQKSNQNSSFAKCIKKTIGSQNLQNIDDCYVFIEQLKEIPTIYMEWGSEEKNMLDFVSMPTKKLPKEMKPNPNIVPFNQKCLNSIQKPINENISNQNKQSQKKKISLLDMLNTDKINSKQRIPPIPNKNRNTKQSPGQREELRHGIPSADVKTVKGLPNVGVACYLISALQTLYDDTGFRTTVLKCTPSGPNKKQMRAVKLIFQHLNGLSHLKIEDLKDLYKTLGYKGEQDDSRWTQEKIYSWFTKNDHKNETLVIEYCSVDVNLNLYIEDFYIRNGYNDEFSPQFIEVNIGRRVLKGKDMTPIEVEEILTFGKNRYLLNSLVTHSGDDNNGHYMSYTKRGNTWVKRNDSKVTVHNWDSIEKEIRTNCTFLRYEKIK